MNDAAPHLVAIGASGADGVRDIIDLLRALRKQPAAVIMVVLHRPSDKISYLRDVLAQNCDIPIVIAAEAEHLTPGTYYVGEPDGHLTLVDRNLAHLVPGAGHRLRNRSVDTLFNSLAKHAGPRTIGIVLSGALDDGSRGLAAIRAAGGVAMVLEPGSKPRGMQLNAIDYNNPVDFIGTTQEIADRIRQVIANANRRS